MPSHYIIYNFHSDHQIQRTGSRNEVTKTVNLIRNSAVAIDRVTCH